jgi:hypothetical protein
VVLGDSKTKTNPVMLCIYWNKELVLERLVSPGKKCREDGTATWARNSETENRFCTDV